MADSQSIVQRREAVTSTQRREAVTSTNKVLRNTYMLLSMTLIWSAAMAGVAMAMNVPYMGWVPMLVAFGLLFAISRFRNSAWGVALVFAFTGILGFSLGPVLNFYMASAGGGMIVMEAAGLTGIIFLSLSAYALVTKKDFSYMAGFLMTGMWVIIGAMLLSIVGAWMGYQVSMFQLAISCGVVILMSGFILFETSRIVNGGETNYIMATVSLYLDIYNLFVSLLRILSAVNR